MTTPRNMLLVSLCGLALIFATGTARAAEFWLWAGPTQGTMPDGAVIAMWGFAEDDTGSFADGLDGAVSIPGPMLTIPPGDSTLVIHLANALPLMNEQTVPVSIVIPGQRASLAPVRRADGRLRSFTHEALPGAPATYTWSDVTPGTYLYHSGTHPALQVQMGLYGGVRKDAGAGLAYDGIFYDHEVVLFYSEVDPTLHAAVAADDYGSGKGTTSTIDYNPKYFLVNGAPFTLGRAPSPAGQPGQRTLIRFLNAGLGTHVPVLLDTDFVPVAEDGRPSPHQLEQCSVHLPALKTLDAIVVNPEPGLYPIFDRRLDLTNAGASPGGLLSYIEVSEPSNQPTAADDVAITIEDEAVALDALANDRPTMDPTTLVVTSGPAHGSVVVQGDGTVIYTPAPNFDGTDTFTYTVWSGGLVSNEATVSITVAAVADPPAAVGETYHVTAGTSLAIPSPGLLANDTDADGDPLATVLVTGPSAGTLSLQSDGSFVYTPIYGATADVFGYAVSDGTFTSALAFVAISIDPPPNVQPVAVDDTAVTRRNTPLSIAVLANDSDSDGALIPGSVVVVSGPSVNGSTAVGLGDGKIRYTPRRNFRGTDVFTYRVSDDDGASSNTATVHVNVVQR